MLAQLLVPPFHWAFSIQGRWWPPFVRPSHWLPSDLLSISSLVSRDTTFSQFSSYLQRTPSQTSVHLHQQAFFPSGFHWGWLMRERRVRSTYLSHAPSLSWMQLAVFLHSRQQLCTALSNAKGCNSSWLLLPRVCTMLLLFPHTFVNQLY